MDKADATRRMAALGFWVAAVLFTTNVAILQDWVATPSVAAQGQSVAQPPSGPTTITLDTGATVEFPQPPTRSEQILQVAGADVVLVLHSAQGLDGATYNLGTIEYPPQVNLDDPAANLIASVSGAAGNVGGRVLDQTVTVYQGAAAVEFRVEAADVQLTARHVLHGRRLYAQNVAYRGEEAPPETTAFFTTFQLPAQGPAAPASDATATPQATTTPTTPPAPEPTLVPAPTPAP